MGQKLVVAVICGTSRESRLSIAAAKWVAEQGRQRGDAEIVFVDPIDFTLPGDGDDIHDPRYTAITARADAFYVVTPEYNHSIPGSLKRLIDSEDENYHHKPVATAGVSNGPWGGTRVCEALLHVYHTLWMVPIKPELYFPKIQDMFDESGVLKPAFVAQQTRSVGKAYDELLWYAQLLKAGRAARA